VNYINNTNFSAYNSASASVRQRLGITRLSPTQAEAVRVAVAKHKARAASKQQVELMQANRYLHLQNQRRQDFVVALGEAYHRRVQTLYQSERAQVVYGKGGQDAVDYDAYARSYGYPARWKNAGARIEGQAGAWFVVLETYRGTEVARIPVDFAQSQRLQLKHPALIDGDLWGIERHGIVERYAWKRRKIVKIGVSVQFSRITRPPGGFTQQLACPETVIEWEHGVDIAACRVENEDKIKLRLQQWENYRARFMSRNLSADLKPWFDRVVQRILRFCPSLPIVYQDARAVGHCDAGIHGWCKRHGIDPDGRTTLKQLMGNPSSEQVARHVAFRQAMLLYQKRQNK
jgi:hypothetical protein